LKYKYCPNCNSDNITLIKNKTFLIANYAFTIFFLFLTIFNTESDSTESLFLGVIYIFAVLNLWILYFKLNRFYKCNSCDLEFNFDSKKKQIIKYQNIDSNLNKNNFLNFDILFKIFVIQFCIYFGIGILLIIIFTFIMNSGIDSSIFVLIYIFTSVPLGSALICVISIESEKSIARSFNLKIHEIDFKKVYGSLAKLLTLLTTFYTIAFTRITHREIFNFDIFLWTNIAIFSMAFSNFILEFNHYKNE
jgi:hypothetical protein